ncbi:MAG: hypothetical protein QOJ07_2896 [Thermoleophilaceae bacterium]|jgi:alkylhydroperoxidase family enzyme|nr:hypothetical protein [Thermoleophilaceae bacterium]
MARVPYVDPEAASPAAQAALERLPPLNVFRLVALADSAFVPWLRFGGALLGDLELDPKLRELAILLVAARSEAEYEWVQHVGIGKAVGLVDEQIAALERGDLGAADFDPAQQAALAFVAAMLDRPRPDDELFAALGEHLPPRQIVELLLVAGAYQMLAHVMTALDIDLDPAADPSFIESTRRADQGD